MCCLVVQQWLQFDRSVVYGIVSDAVVSNKIPIFAFLSWFVREKEK
jgi:hypothetical protein